MIPFRVHFRPGVSLYEQIVYAAKKAFISGRLRPGDTFPSVRTLSRELKINPNTAHKVVANLVSANLLETKPGVGTVVAVLPESTAAERTHWLGEEIEELVVEQRVGYSLVVNLHIGQQLQKRGPPLELRFQRFDVCAKSTQPGFKLFCLCRRQRDSPGRG